MKGAGGNIVRARPRVARAGARGRGVDRRRGERARAREDDARALAARTTRGRRPRGATTTRENKP